MSTDQDNLATSLLDGVKRIDDFKASVDAAGNGTDIEAAWDVIDDMRETLSNALKALGIDVPAYDGQSAAPGPR